MHVTRSYAYMYNKSHALARMTHSTCMFHTLHRRVMKPVHTPLVLPHTATAPTHIAASLHKTLCAHYAHNRTHYAPTRTPHVHNTRYMPLHAYDARVYGLRARHTYINTYASMYTAVQPLTSATCSLNHFTVNGEHVSTQATRARTTQNTKCTHTTLHNRPFRKKKS